MLLSIVLLIIGFVLLIRGADVFIEGAGALAHKLRVPEIIIGLTIVAMGTSAPEAAISIASAIRESGGVAIGNVWGSNIANIFLILGVASTICALAVRRNTVRYEMPFVIFITMLLMWFGWQHGMVSRGVAIALCVLFISFLGYLFYVSRDRYSGEMPEFVKMSGGKTVLYIIGGIAALVCGSEMVVNSAIGIARTLHVSERIIGLTIVAFGTSLPELATGISAALKKRADLAIGGIVGSNIFNILFVLGIAGVIHPVPFEKAFIFDGAVALLAVAMLWLFTLYRTKLMRHHGIIFLGLYVLYISYLVLYS